MRDLDTIFVHCSATQPVGWFAELSGKEQVAEIDRWHKDRGWSGIGYHFYIARDGKHYGARPVHKQGAGVLGHNENSIHICLAGGHGSRSDDAPLDNFTQAQLDELRHMIDALRVQYGPKMVVRGHNEVSHKACPGFNVKKWLKGKRPAPSVAEKTVEKLSKAAPIGTTGGLGAGALVSAFGGWDSHAQILLVGIAGVVVVVGLIKWVWND